MAVRTQDSEISHAFTGSALCVGLYPAHQPSRRGCEQLSRYRAWVYTGSALSTSRVSMDCPRVMALDIVTGVHGLCPLRPCLYVLST